MGNIIQQDKRSKKERMDALAKKRHADDTNNTPAAEPRTKRSKKDDDSYNSATLQRTKDDDEDPNALNMAAEALMSLKRNACPEEEVKTHLDKARNRCDSAINMVPRDHSKFKSNFTLVESLMRWRRNRQLEWDALYALYRQEKFSRETAFNVNRMTGSFNEQLNAEHKDQHREKSIRHPLANSIDYEPTGGYFQGYFDDSRNDKRNLVHTAPENFRNTSFPRCIPREWMALPPYHHARLMAPLLMANACLQSKCYTYEEVINNEDTPVQSFIRFLKMAVTVLSDDKYIHIGNTFGKRRWKKIEKGKSVETAGQLQDSAAGKLEAKWGVQVHFHLSPEAWASYVAGVNKNKRRKTLQFGVFFKSEDDVKARKTIGGTALLIPLKKHAINICERLMSKLEIHCEKQQLEQQLIIDLVTEIIISQQEEVIGDIHHLGSFETIDVDDRFHRALRSICIIIGHLIYNSIILIRQGTFFKQDDETKHLKSTLAGDDSDSSRAGS